MTYISDIMCALTSLLRYLAMALLLAGACDVRSGEAQQTGFSLKYMQNAGVFDYRWTAPVGQQLGGRSEQQVRFVLPLAELERGRREFTAFDNKAANDFAFGKVKAMAQEVSTPTHRLDVQEVGDGFRIVETRFARANAPRPAQEQAVSGEVMTEMTRVRDRALQDYVTNGFYMMIGDNNIMPDHKRIAQRYSRALTPLARTVLSQTGGLDMRGQVDWLLGFFQSIPYDELTNRYTSNGAGFQTPYGLLANNRGDCDTKSVALAALLRNMYPDLKLTMVYVPEHAFIGIGMPKGTGDYALRISGRPFVLADPTGPRFLKLGEVNERALSFLNSGSYSFQEIP